LQKYNSIIGNLLKVIDRCAFKSFVEKYRGEYYSKTMTCWEQLIKLKTKVFKDGRQNLYGEKILKRVIVQRENSSPLILVTNDLKRSSSEIADLYKQRWQIELFFKWIKQNLKIKKFLGRSENAVKTQICIALCTYILLHEAQDLREYLSDICQYFSDSKFLKMINNYIFKTIKPIYRNRTRDNPWQLKLSFA